MSRFRLLCSDGVDRLGETFATKQAALTAGTWRHYCHMDPHRPAAIEISSAVHVGEREHAERPETTPGPLSTPSQAPVPASTSHSTLPAPSVDAATTGETAERRGAFCSGRRSVSDGADQRIGAAR